MSYFLQNSATQRIWCLVRAPGDAEATIRVEESLKKRDLGEIFANHRAKIACHASDVRHTDLGLSVDVLRELINHTSIIVHAAWPVNCKIPLKYSMTSRLKLAVLG